MKHEQEIRYSRQISLPEIGATGQQKLLDAKILVIGAGGLGSPLLLYLAAAGVGTIGIVDHDEVDLSNLGRQVLHETSSIGDGKTESAKEAMLDLNPELTINCYAYEADAETLTALVEQYDIIADGTDNFPTRFAINAACHEFGKTLVSAAVQGFSGQLSVFKSGVDASTPCYRCLHAELPPPESTPTCAEAGVLGSAAGVMGTWQATEVLKEILGLGASLAGKLLIFDALDATSRKVTLPKDPACKCCGTGTA